ncbi:MAG: polymer-forming cytoskeletal protein [Candidatus Omnitrophica bacterium]|nr:polymer-forming cytoskeletal protein [Candidatus Omnitrophota bacterium]
MRRRDRGEEKVLDVDATMQGTLTFKDPVNLRINGSFEGNLDTKGSLTIGEHAVVRATIKGENVVVTGRVFGDIVAVKELKIIPPGNITGNIITPRLIVDEGAVLDGRCQMSRKGGENQNADQSARKSLLSADELAKYLEVDKSMIFEWAKTGKLPGTKEKDTWKFNKELVDEWIADGKVK